MPRVKNSRIKQNKSKNRAQTSQENQQSLAVSKIKNLPNLHFPGAHLSRRVWLLLLIIVILALAYYKKNWFVAALVDGSPITTIQLMQQLNQQYRDQVLNEMINEKIILDQAQKQGVTVSDSEINDRISQLEKNVGGAQVLDSLLTQQGQTRDSLKNQIRVQLSVEKMYQSETTSSAQEIQGFIDQNKDKLTASDSAGQEKEAADLLKQQKLSNVFSTKFQELKQQANVQTF